MELAYEKSTETGQIALPMYKLVTIVIFSTGYQLDLQEVIWEPDENTQSLLNREPALGLNCIINIKQSRSVVHNRIEWNYFFYFRHLL